MRKIVYLLLILVQFHSCSKKTEKTEVEEKFALELTNTIELDAKLKEISGLAYYTENQTLLTHNDEKGIVYELSLENGKIVNEYEVAKNGDFEGIAYHNQIIYLITSEGKLHLYSIANNSTEIIDLGFKKANNIEGLTMYSDTEILIAFKGKTPQNDRFNKCIYVYDLEKKAMNMTPIISVSKDKLKTWFIQQNANLDPKTLKKLLKRLQKIAPSGVFYDKSKEQFYLISARGSTFIAIGANNEIMHVDFFNEITTPQPEGILLLPNNNWVVASEGKKRGVLHFFTSK